MSYWSESADCDTCLPATWHEVSRVNMSSSGNDYEILPHKETGRDENIRVWENGKDQPQNYVDLKAFI